VAEAADEAPELAPPLAPARARAPWARAESDGLLKTARECGKEVRNDAAIAGKTGGK
jgi:hypothetical protein